MKKSEVRKREQKIKIEKNVVPPCKSQNFQCANTDELKIPVKSVELQLMKIIKILIIHSRFILSKS